MSRGQAWFDALSTTKVDSPYPSVAIGDADLGDGVNARLLAVIPDPTSPFLRARAGEVGLREGVGLAHAVREVVARGVGEPDDRLVPIVAIVDVPSQAYGRVEEIMGEHHFLAAAVDAYASARVAGHPIIAIVVGSAISGGFLAHGLQANQILALDDGAVEIHAMHKAAAARVTLRTTAELDELASRVTPLSYAVADWATLGFCDGLLDVSNADQPTDDDVGRVRSELRDAVARARAGPADLSNRLRSSEARTTRAASIEVRRRVTEQWG